MFRRPNDGTAAEFINAHALHITTLFSFVIVRLPSFGAALGASFIPYLHIYLRQVFVFLTF